MHPFKLGDVVVCVNDTPLPDKIIRIGESWVKIGRIYLISGTSTNEVGDHGVILLGLKQSPPAVGWHAWRFRKIHGDVVLSKLGSKQMRKSELV